MIDIPSNLIFALSFRLLSVRGVCIYIYIYRSLVLQKISTKEIVVGCMCRNRDNSKEIVVGRMCCTRNSSKEIVVGRM